MTPRVKSLPQYLLVAAMVLTMAVQVVRAEVLVLAVVDTPPTAFRVDGKPAGMLVELVAEAYRRAGYAVEFKLMPWVRCLEEARSGEVDGVFSSFKLPEREEFLNFPREVLTTQVIAFFARRDANATFDGNLTLLRDTSIGVIRGTSYGRTFDAAVVDGTLKRVDRVNSIENNLKKLVSGRVDLIPSYRYVALYEAKNQGVLSEIEELSPSLESVPSYLAFTKVRDLSRQSADFDAALASMKRDGTYDRIVEKYIR